MTIGYAADELTKILAVWLDGKLASNRCRFPLPSILDIRAVKPPL
jgi:hypothetical protein